MAGATLFVCFSSKVIRAREFTSCKHYDARIHGIGEGRLDLSDQASKSHEEEGKRDRKNESK